ncbi:MAG: hypothetical protein MMC33_006105 [Icmadophila ericetorum]|nr:hypothetical protein [Icmadophila ericetorum]
MLQDAELSELEKQVEESHLADINRHQTAKKLLVEYHALKREYKDKLDDYDNGVRSRREQEATTRGAVGSDNRSRPVVSQDYSDFVLVLIDGDGCSFHKALIQDGYSGGRRAAQLLFDQIQNYIRDRAPYALDCKIMVQIYAGFLDITDDLIRNGVIGQRVEFIRFTHGFVRHQSLFDFEDIGSGRERADHKVKDKLRLFLNLRQCKHVIFGGCHDKNYIQCLEPYNGNISHLTLLEADKVARGFEDLKFPRCKFPFTFVSNQFSVKRLSTLQEMNRSTTMRISNGNLAADMVESTTQEIAQDWRSIYHKSIILNKNGQRLDPKIPMGSREAEWSLGVRQKKSKLCYDHLLAGCCRSVRCPLNHDPINSHEELCLRKILRKKVCPNGLACRSFDCYFGHQCPFPVCYYGQDCQFAKSHGAIQAEAKRIYRDDSSKSSSMVKASATPISRLNRPVVPKPSKVDRSISRDVPEPPKIDKSASPDVSRLNDFGLSEGLLIDICDVPRTPPRSMSIVVKAPSTESSPGREDTTMDQSSATVKALSGHVEEIVEGVPAVENEFKQKCVDYNKGRPEVRQEGRDMLTPAVFQNALLHAAHEGGIQAAPLLLGEIQDYVQLRDVRANQWDIMVQIYAGYKGLMGDLIRSGVQKLRGDFHSFTAGFIRYQESFDFPDIGTGLECASHKIKSWSRSCG